jgi:hypothetical protein
MPVFQTIGNSDYDLEIKDYMKQQEWFWIEK